MGTTTPTRGGGGLTTGETVSYRTGTEDVIINTTFIFKSFFNWGLLKQRMLQNVINFQKIHVYIYNVLF